MKDRVVFELLTMLSQGETPSAHVDELSIEIFGGPEDIDDVVKELMALRERCNIDFITDEQGVISFWKTKPTLLLTAGAL